MLPTIDESPIQLSSRRTRNGAPDVIHAHGHRCPRNCATRPPLLDPLHLRRPPARQAVHSPSRMQKEECRMKKSGLIASALQFSAPPQARRVLETQLRRLALDANCFFILHSAFFILVMVRLPESHQDGGRAQALYLAGRHSAVKPQPRN